VGVAGGGGCRSWRRQSGEDDVVDPAFDVDDDAVEASVEPLPAPDPESDDEPPPDPFLVLEPLLDESDELGGVLVDDGVLLEPLRLSLR
jgi:hypothetical protein